MPEKYVCPRCGYTDYTKLNYCQLCDHELVSSRESYFGVPEKEVVDIVVPEGESLAGRLIRRSGPGISIVSDPVRIDGDRYKVPIQYPHSDKIYYTIMKPRTLDLLRGYILDYDFASAGALLRRKDK